MNAKESESAHERCLYEDKTRLAERELSSFLAAVTELYGPEKARRSTEDWLKESELMAGSHRSEVLNWRAVTIAAAGRLANRLSVKTA